jgi:signal transduction histidine kinase/CheY-like chemotaxis protein
MPTPRRHSIKHKLAWILISGCTTAVLVSCAMFVFMDMTRIRDGMVDSLTARANLISSQSRTALVAKNPAAINDQLLQSVNGQPAIQAIAIYTENGNLLASYTRPELPPSNLVPALEDGLHSGTGHMTLVQPIVLDGKRIGTVSVRASTMEMTEHLTRSLGIILGILVVCSALILLLMSRLHPIVIEPILQVVRTMKTVSREKNYAVRAYKRSDDELGELVEAFNEMMGQVQHHDSMMEKARTELESRMQERTSKLEQEIAERTRLEQQLLQAQKMEALGQLAGGIAHDFNNLLTVIMGNLSLARLQAGPDGKVAALLQAAEQGTHRASDLTRQLLAVGRRTFSMPTALDLHNVVQEVVQILRRTIDPRIVIDTPSAEVVWMVHADSGQMFQALMNLCVNARDAMPDGGRLRIELQNITKKPLGLTDGPSACFVRLSVSDTGVGMNPETCRRIFEPFFTTKEVGKGMGLGLAMVYGIVTQNKGTITVDSRLGAGSKFTIELPRYTERDTDAEISVQLLEDATLDVHAPEGTGETILVVEDEDEIRMLVRKVLEQLGYKVVEAEDGVRGLSVYQAHPGKIAAVILDLTMPKKSGLDVLASLRQLNPTVRVILSSGYSAAAQKLDLPKLGVMAFLQKPYVPNELARTLRTVLDQQT